MSQQQAQRRAQLTGNRIRERRLVMGLKQAELATQVGISASYLNLIEHNRRRIGGKLLVDLARVLAVEPAALTEGADASLRATLHTAAQAVPETLSPHAPQPPELDRIDEFTTRFPGWTELIAAQDRRISQLEATIEGLRDRLTHDPTLAEAMHEVLSSVAAIRTTADILVREADIDAAWRGRFHRNLHEEAERLSGRATGLLDQFELPGGAEAMIRPVERVEAMFDAAGHHFPEIEADGAAAIPAIIARAADLSDPDSRTLAESWLTSYAQDAATLPFDRFLPQIQAAGYDPALVLAQGAGNTAQVLRRMACLPPSLERASFGLAVIDATGALLFRRRSPGFSLPRYGVSCPRWPIYRALSRPGQPEQVDVTLSGRGRFRTWSVAEQIAQLGFGQAPIVQATMLVQEIAPDTPPGETPPLEVGPDCPTCRATPHIPRQ